MNASLPTLACLANRSPRALSTRSGSQPFAGLCVRMYILNDLVRSNASISSATKDGRPDGESWRRQCVYHYISIANGKIPHVQTLRLKHGKITSRNTGYNFSARAQINGGEKVVFPPTSRHLGLTRLQARIWSKSAWNMPSQVPCTISSPSWSTTSYLVVEVTWCRARPRFSAS